MYRVGSRKIPFDTFQGHRNLIKRKLKFLICTNVELLYERQFGGQGNPIQVKHIIKGTFISYKSKSVRINPFEDFRVPKKKITKKKLKTPSNLSFPLLQVR